MIKAAVIGHPIAQSLSPIIHNYWFDYYGIDGEYKAVDLAPDRLAQGIYDLISQGYTGFNITVPHKQPVMSVCDNLDQSARAIGAVNTLVVKDRKIEGRNTDAYGFIENIKKEKPDFDFGAGAATILGAGGAARAVVQGLLAAGVPKIYITNRTKENAALLAADFQRAKLWPWEDRETPPDNTRLLVNTTILGMRGQADLGLDLSAMPANLTVCDIVYKPLITTLLQQAQERKMPIITGIGMLLHQARPAFAAWTGVFPEVTPDLTAKILEAAI